MEKIDPALFDSRARLEQLAEVRARAFDTSRRLGADLRRLQEKREDVRRRRHAFERDWRRPPAGERDDRDQRLAKFEAEEAALTAEIDRLNDLAEDAAAARKAAGGLFETCMEFAKAHGLDVPAEV